MVALDLVMIVVLSYLIGYGKKKNLFLTDYFAKDPFFLILHYIGQYISLPTYRRALP